MQPRWAPAVPVLPAAGKKCALVQGKPVGARKSRMTVTDSNAWSVCW